MGLMPQLQYWPALAGAKLFAYASTTTTKQDTYTTAAVDTENTNPLVADSNGRFSPIWLDPALAYTFVLAPSTDSDPPVAAIYTVDGVTEDSGLALTVLSKSANYSVVSGDGADVLILVDASGGAVTITLYTAAGNEGQKVRVIKTDASNNAVTLDASASETIGGALTQVIDRRYGGAAIASDNTNWLNITPKEPLVLSKTAAYTVALGDGDDVTVLADGTAGAYSVTLYPAAGNKGRRITVKKTDSGSNAITLDGNASEEIDGATTYALAAQYDWVTLECDGAGWQIISKSVTVTGAADFEACDGRLTLTTAVPVTRADVAAGTTLFWALLHGNRIGLYDGSSDWNVRTSIELSITLVGLTASKPYDAFIYDNSGTPTIELLVWTDLTNRATALVSQDGILVKSGATTRRFIGTVWIDSGGGAASDTEGQRHLYNYYHKHLRSLFKNDSTSSWVYTSATRRQAGGDTGNQVSVMVGVEDVSLNLTLIAGNTNSSGNASRDIVIGFDSTTARMANCRHWNTGQANSGSEVETALATVSDSPVLGWHKWVWIERVSNAVGSNTWYGDQGNNYSGFSGLIWI